MLVSDRLPALSMLSSVSQVLILVLVDVGLGRVEVWNLSQAEAVLILVLVDVGLGLYR